MMKNVDIAMATYNGEKYIEEQISSIQNQTYKDWNLYISDDGSTDQTISIVKKISSLDPRIKLINVERQGGVISNFNKALDATSAEYVLLCDQDDIWPENRLNLLLTRILKLENENPRKGVLVFTDLELIDQNANVISDSFYESNGIDPKSNINSYDLIWNSTVYGCTTIMNRVLLNQALPVPNYASMHDQWLALTAKTYGVLHYYEIKSIHYRQHSDNVVGGTTKKGFGKLRNYSANFKRVKKNVKKINKILKLNPNFYEGNNLKILKFVFKEIFPNIFFGKKRIYTIFIFIVFLLYRD